jgi:tryptophan-rich sensory protein
MIRGRKNPFKVEEMQMKTLEQPMANNECGFYIMWAMLYYLGGRSSHAVYASHFIYIG